MGDAMTKAPWPIVESLPDGWMVDHTVGSPLARHVFVTNGKSVLNGQKRALMRVKPKPLPAANAAEVMTQCAAKPSPQSPWTTYAPESARSVQELARARAKQQLLTDIRMDMTICEIEGWDKKEYLSELRDMINQLGTGGMEAKA